MSHSNRHVLYQCHVQANHRQFGPLPNQSQSNRPPEKSILVKSAPLEITPSQIDPWEYLELV